MATRHTRSMQPSRIPGHMRFPHFKSVIKRVPGGFVRMWKRGQHGWFFMYPDRVLRVTCDSINGWVHQVVPEEGLPT
jgi:hypothetical protein